MVSYQRNSLLINPILKTTQKKLQ